MFAKQCILVLHQKKLSLLCMAWRPYVCILKIVKKIAVDTTNHHSLKTYSKFQLQQWKQNILIPLDWSWKKSKNGLIPIRTTNYHTNICKNLEICCSMFCKKCMSIYCDYVAFAHISKEVFMVILILNLKTC